MLNVLRCRLTYYGQAETNAEAWFNIALRPRKPEGSLGRTAQDGHLDSHTAPELCPAQPRYIFDLRIKKGMAIRVWQIIFKLENDIIMLTWQTLLFLTAFIQRYSSLSSRLIALAWDFVSQFPMSRMWW